ncbi:hypothetical protein PCASD_14262 [Puccinia coronata f. sp. avenae]|uniref:Uncharacterized protein n=1 Tax=Puccinia coronata f. sp. avenae TaxID=200324 RepID=A0A2N5TEZ5_9BASI|nr:hypothetical protein PCASD_14262 [Puccinia coronata f. sp. avenae]
MQKNNNPSVVIDPPTPDGKKSRKKTSPPSTQTSPPSDQQSNASSDQLHNPSLVAKNSSDNWQLPVAMSQEFSTFIDHGCTLDKQGYPLFPNRSTTYVLPAGAEIENFEKEECNYTGPPPTGVGKIDKLLSRNPTCPGLAGRCPGKVYLQRCTQAKCRFDFHKSGWALMRHRGFHDHPWPTRKKPDPLALKELKSEMEKNPKLTALQLKIGNPSATNEQFENVEAIHKSLGNGDCLRYYRRLIVDEINEEPEKKGSKGASGAGGDKFLMDMFQWDQKGMHIISNSFRRGHEHFTFQTLWMSERLLDRCEDGNKLYSGGLISDVTYRFFSSGYLLTTSMYCDDIGRWIPVQLSWIRGLSEE